MLRRIDEQTNSVTSTRARRVVRTFHLVGRRGIGDDTVGHVLQKVPYTESPDKLNKTLQLRPLPLFLEAKASKRPGMLDGGK